MTNQEFSKPERIYKYVPLDIAKIILQDITLKFSKPSTFNDPFDCDVNLVDFNFSGKINEKVFEEIKALKNIFKDKLDSRSNEFWEKAYRGTQLEKINGSRICCFSLINDNMLMWSHYAKLNGVCLEFDNLLHKKFIGLSDKIDISEGEVGYIAKERINYVAEERKFAIYKLFFCKSEEWNYEKEFRMILLNNKKEFQQFNKNFLKGIYFGINTSEEEIKSIVGLAHQNDYKDLKFFTSNKGDFSINFTRFSPSA